MLAQTRRPDSCLINNAQRQPRRGIVARVASTDVKEPLPTPTAGERTRLRTLEDLPREVGIPILGSALPLVDEDFEIASMFEKHQTDAFHVNLGPGAGWHVIVQSIELMDELQIAKGKDSYPKWSGGVEDLALPTGVSKTNQQIRPWRAATGKILSNATIMQMQLPLVVQEFTSTIRKHAASGEQVKFFDVSKRLTFSAACRASIGDVLTRTELDDLFPLAKTVGQGVFSMSLGLKEGLPFTTYWRAHQAQKVLQNILTERISKVLKEDRGQLDGKDAVVKTVLSELEAEGVDTSSSGGRDITARLAKEVIWLMFVGTDTTSYTMSRSMVWLSKHPDWLAALNEEQDRLIDEHGPELDRKVFSRSAVAMAIAQEVLRLTPPVRLLFRLTQKDMTVGDIAVPEGTRIALSPRKAMLETGSGTKKFDPQHWLSEDRSTCRVNDEPGNFVFGKGNRACIGKNLAVTELVTFLAILGREVASIEISKEEQEQTFFIIGDHPTGLPLKLTARAACSGSAEEP